MELRTGYKQTEVGVIPSDWEVRKVGEEFEIKLGKMLDAEKNIGIPKFYIGNRSVQWNRIDTIDLPVMLISRTELERFRLRFGDLLVCEGGEVGRAAIWEEQIEECYFQKALHRLRPIRGFNTRLMLSILHYWSANNKLSDYVTQTSIAHLTREKFLSIPLPIPPNPEQTAIATALSDADQYITHLEKLIAKKRNIKQGAMQELLKPKEGWVVRKLGEIVSIKKGQLITESTRIDGNIPVIAGGKTPAYYHNKPNRLGRTITISGSGASAGYVAFHDCPIFASDCSTIEEGKDYSIEFIYFLLQLLQEKIYQMQTGGAQPHIHPSDLNPVEVSIPKHEIQIRIATTLSDMDAEISTLETKLSKAKSIKQGMMQQLLTGKIRLV